MLRMICLVLYYGFARYLPRSNAPFSFGAKRIRYALCKRLFKNIGKNVNVERLAYFRDGHSVEIGDNSGLGVNCHISNALIGDNVMMGPDVLYINSNHCFDRTDVPMMQQGKAPLEKLTIGDDV